MEIININHVSKIIKRSLILDDITVSFESGKIYGLIGRNGSGKTMLLRTICGLATPTYGTITVNGKIIGQDIEIPESIGVIIEVPGFLPDMTGFDNLCYLASLKNKIGESEVSASMILCGLNPASKKRVSKYSLGMRQRLGIAQAIMENPQILLLDEPMNGLDNEGVEDVKKLLKNLKQEGKLIILASHHLEDINELCDKVYRMEQGRLCEQSIYPIPNY